MLSILLPNSQFSLSQKTALPYQKCRHYTWFCFPHNQSIDKFWLYLHFMSEVFITCFHLHYHPGQKLAPGLQWLPARVLVLLDLPQTIFHTVARLIVLQCETNLWFLLKNLLVTSLCFQIKTQIAHSLLKSDLAPAYLTPLPFSYYAAPTLTIQFFLCPMCEMLFFFYNL